MAILPKVICRVSAAAAAEVTSVLNDSVRPLDGSPPGSPCLGFSRQEHRSGLPFPSPMHESEKCSHYQNTKGIQTHPTKVLLAYSVYNLLLLSECFSGGPILKNTTTNERDARDTVSIPVLGRSPELGNGNPPQYSCLENYTNGGAQQSTGSQRVSHG